MNKELLKQYEATIGLEIHIQLHTNTKAFSFETNGITEHPNQYVGVFSLGHPGTLPVLNPEVVTAAIQLGVACGCDIAERSAFDRKHYFYPDLPKGYQITQAFHPICTGGCLPIGFTEESIALNRIHIEEDAGKLIHEQEHSLVDYNRAGVPLLEIVTEPVIHSSNDALALLKHLRWLVRFLGIGDADMEKGQLRCDVNISVRHQSSAKLGKKVEVKNLNSFKHVQKAIDFEFERQVSILNDGGDIEEETRLFDAVGVETRSMRSKENHNDYRYMPDPDIPDIVLTREQVERVVAHLPVLPKAYFREYSSYGFSEKDVVGLFEDVTLVKYLSELASLVPPKKALNWINGPVKEYLNQGAIALADVQLSPEKSSELILLVESGKIAYNVASKEIFRALIQNPEKKLESILNELNLGSQVSDSAMSEVISAKLTDYPNEVSRYLKGESALVGFFMGVLMKVLRGQADPQKVKELLLLELNKR